jgi:hypothetical protein
LPPPYLIPIQSRNEYEEKNILTIVVILTIVGAKSRLYVLGLARLYGEEEFSTRIIENGGVTVEGRCGRVLNDLIKRCGQREGARVD